MNIKKGKMIVRIENPRKSENKESIMCQFCKCWVNKRCSSIRGRVKQDVEFKCWICAVQEKDTGCPGVLLNDVPLKLVKKFCCLGGRWCRWGCR